jgi:SAM-dependent methyltransferase
MRAREAVTPCAGSRRPDKLSGQPGEVLIGSRPCRSDNQAKYRSRNPLVRYLVERFLAEVARLVAERAPGRSLEVGCGEGLVLEYLRRRHPRLRVDGLEPDGDALRAARLRNPGTRLVHGDAYDLPIAAASYDLVLCLEVLEHLEDPGRALAELRRVARRGCILSVPHEPFFRIGNLLRGKNVRRLGDPPDHVQHWTRRGFESLCRQHVRIDRTVLSFPWIIVAASV